MSTYGNSYEYCADDMLAADEVAVLERRLALNQAQQRRLREEEASLREQLDALMVQEAAAELAVASAAVQPADWAGSFEWDSAVDELLRTGFGHGTFRPLQREVINATLSGRDTFAILPTGSGKSLLYQLPGLLEPTGLSVVISPLVSLMIDQCASLTERGVSCALLAADLTDRSATTAIHHQIEDAGVSGLRFLYVTPERLAKSKLLLAKLQKAHLAKRLQRFAIDEAHCACAMGHDFRPDYLQLGVLRSSFPGVPLLALTATASDAVRADVERSLQMAAGAATVRFRGHFDRPNLRYAVRRKPADDALHQAEMASLCLATFRGQAGIVYTLSRADAERVAGGLSQRGVRCAAYHAGVEVSTRQQIAQAWHSGQLQVVIATIAFGMGIDKADVRFVLRAPHRRADPTRTIRAASGTLLMPPALPASPPPLPHMRPDPTCPGPTRPPRPAPAPAQITPSPSRSRRTTKRADGRAVTGARPT